MANTDVTQSMQDAMRSAQAITPRNWDDAWYIVAHASEFTPADVRLAHYTLDSEEER